MGALTDVAEFARGRQPLSPVRSPRTGDCVRNFVQQNLVDLIVVESRSKILRNRDFPLRVVALAGSGLGIIEAEGPVAAS